MISVPLDKGPRAPGDLVYPTEFLLLRPLAWREMYVLLRRACPSST